ncbi:MAG: flagellar biosynthetic protein FliR [Candidatus Sumerlaeota bacterium]|nr:flagellar biosynthetic protein FliR [Candidatus Sumerlaeota bacterium]
MTLLHIIDLNEARLLVFMAVLTRVTFLIAFLPLWGEEQLPIRVRILLVIGIAIVLTPAAPVNPATFPSSLGELIAGVGMEAAFGFSVCLLIRMVFAAVQMAGQITGEQMGFSIANVLAPDMSSQITIIAEAKYGFAALIFFVMNFHLMFFRAIARSMEMVPIFQARPGVSLFPLLQMTTQSMFVTALQMSAPIMATMIFISVALGLLNKAVPQMNVFMESFPIRISLGLFIFANILMALARFMEGSFASLERTMTAMVRAWG